MNAEFIRGLLRHQPFEPFKVILSNGETFMVKHPEQGFLAGSRFIIYYPETDSVNFCSLLHIADIKMGQIAA
jgi:hypothetical protein